MNQEEALALLRKHDGEGWWDLPAGYNFRDAMPRFREFVAALDAATGVAHEVETDSMIQEATFHSQVALNSAWLRFSIYGTLVSITDERAVDDATLAVVNRLCEEMGYLYIPRKFTELPYEGDPRGYHIPNWWARYFNWI